ncbi:MAG: cobalamin-binding protein [Deltaproteobacteria bacterium]|nr:cobalamin-binding protein [Deltaproteobacteria bacterium]
MPCQEDILTALTQAVIKFREKDCKDAARKALDQGVDPMIAVNHGLMPGMKKVGILFDTNEYFVPEVMLSTDAFYAAFEILRPHIPKKRQESELSIVIGSIQGDIHDIGKNLVKIMFEAEGWEVHDLGRDVPLEQFVEKHLEVKSDVIAISAMMTTTMMGMKKVIALAKKESPECLVMVGGASVTREIADLFGADGYARSSGVAVAECRKMVKQYHTFKQKLK